MPRWLVVVIAVGAMAAAAVVESVFSNRWNDSQDVRTAAAKLDGVPATFGDWTSTEQPQSEKVLRIAEAAGHVSRIYTNRKNGAEVSVLLLCGPTGPIGAHTPEVCYEGNGFTMSGEPLKQTVVLPDNTTANYWQVLFEKKSAAFEPPLRVCWMWGVDGEWHASTSPRSEFALRRALYKLYVVRAEPRAAAGTPTPKTDWIQEFLKDFLPEVQKSLTAAPANTK